MTTRALCAVALFALVCSGCRPRGDRNAPQLGGMAARGYDLQGHRGARGLKPENTIPAFETALDYGVDTLELDLHWSADDQLIVWHDPVIDPKKCHIPDDAPASLRIRDLTAEQLGHFVCDLNPDPGRFTDQTADPTELAGARYGIATLAHVLDFVDQYAAADVKPGPRRSNARIVRFNFETKRGDGAIADGFDGTNAGPFETALVEMLRQRSLEQRATIQSFDHRSLWAIRALQPRITLSALTEEGVVPDLEELQSRGATVWSPNYEDLTADIVAKAHAIGIRVIPWTVNDPQAMTELLQIGVDGLITDRPDLAPATR